MSIIALPTDRHIMEDCMLIGQREAPNLAANLNVASKTIWRAKELIRAKIVQCT